MNEKWLRWRTRKRAPASAVDVTAQAMYQHLVNDSLSPALRELGFKGSGGRYSLPCADCWAQLGFQKSGLQRRQGSAVHGQPPGREDLDWAEARSERPYLPERPAPGTIYGGDVAAYARIGDLTPERSDRWWRVYGEVDAAAVVADVMPQPAQRQKRMSRSAARADGFRARGRAIMSR
jgi:hypothetical protein